MTKDEALGRVRLAISWCSERCHYGVERVVIVDSGPNPPVHPRETMCTAHDCPIYECFTRAWEGHHVEAEDCPVRYEDRRCVPPDDRSQIEREQWYMYRGRGADDPIPKWMLR